MISYLSVSYPSHVESTVYEIVKLMKEGIMTSDE